MARTTHDPDVSVVVPAFNERESLPTLLDEIQAAMTAWGVGHEVILVDDGSTDGTPQACAEWQVRHPTLRYVRFRRNRGKSDAYVTGFRACRGEYVLTLDADLQDDPAELPKLRERFEAGFDLVVGSKHGRMRNEPMKALASRPFNLMLSLLFRLRMRDSNSGYRLMRREVADALVPRLYGDLYRFIPQMSHTLGFRVTEVDVVHRAREHGISKFGATRFWTGMLDAVTTFFLLRSQRRPLHFFATIGLVPLALGTGLEVYALVMKLLGESFQQHVAAILIGVLMITLGVQASLTGLLAELLVSQRNYLGQSMGGDSLRPPPMSSGGQAAAEPFEVPAPGLPKEHR